MQSIKNLTSICSLQCRMSCFDGQDYGLKMNLPLSNHRDWVGLLRYEARDLHGYPEGVLWVGRFS